MLSVQIVGSSLKYLQGELNASIEQISYVMSASLITEVIIIPFSGWLIRVLSTRILFLISLFGFIFSSIGCAFSDTFLLMTFCICEKILIRIGILHYYFVKRGTMRNLFRLYHMFLLTKLCI